MKSPLKSPIEFISTGQLKKILSPKSTISSFFLYAGHIEVALACAGHTVVAHTNKQPVYEFCAILMDDPKLLFDAATQVFPTIVAPQFYNLQENWMAHPEAWARAALFFILNRC